MLKIKNTSGTISYVNTDNIVCIHDWYPYSEKEKRHTVCIVLKYGEVVKVDLNSAEVDQLIELTRNGRIVEFGK